MPIRFNDPVLILSDGKHSYKINLKPIIWILRIFRIAKRIKETT